MLKGPEWVAVSRGEMRGLHHPFVLSTFGKLGCEGDRFFQDLSSGFRSADPDFDTDQHLGALYMQQLQMVLRREVARMLLQGQADYASADDDCKPSAYNDMLDDYLRMGAEYGPSPPGPHAGDNDMLS